MMTKMKVFSSSAAFAAILISGMALIAGTTGTFAGTAAAANANTANSKSQVIVHDHRHTDSPSTSTSAPPAAAPGTATTTPKAVVGGNETRDHRAGGNADACLKNNNTCNAAARSTSASEYRKKNPAMVGLDGDPCLHTNGCNKSDTIQSQIARAQKNLNIGFCDSRITGQGCAQIMVLPNGKQMTLHFDHNKGHLLPADQQKLISELQTEYNQSLGGGGAAPSGPKRQQF